MSFNVLAIAKRKIQKFCADSFFVKGLFFLLLDFNLNNSQYFEIYKQTYISPTGREHINNGSLLKLFAQHNIQGDQFLKFLQNQPTNRYSLYEYDFRRNFTRHFFELKMPIGIAKPEEFQKRLTKSKIEYYNEFIDTCQYVKSQNLKDYNFILSVKISHDREILNKIQNTLNITNFETLTTDQLNYIKINYPYIYAPYLQLQTNITTSIPIIHPDNPFQGIFHVDEIQYLIKVGYQIDIEEGYNYIGEFKENYGKQYVSAFFFLEILYCKYKLININFFTFLPHIDNSTISLLKNQLQYSIKDVKDLHYNIVPNINFNENFYLDSLNPLYVEYIYFIVYRIISCFEQEEYNIKHYFTEQLLTGSEINHIYDLINKFYIGKEALPQVKIQYFSESFGNHFKDYLIGSKNTTKSYNNSLLTTRVFVAFTQQEYNRDMLLIGNQFFLKSIKNKRFLRKKDFLLLLNNIYPLINNRLNKYKINIPDYSYIFKNAINYSIGYAGSAKSFSPSKSPIKINGIKLENAKDPYFLHYLDLTQLDTFYEILLNPITHPEDKIDFSNNTLALHPIYYEANSLVFKKNINFFLNHLVRVKSRIDIHELIIKILKEGGEVYYTNTDSVFTNRKQDVSEKHIGALAQKYDNIKFAYFASISNYVIFDDNGFHIKGQQKVLKNLNSLLNNSSLTRQLLHHPTPITPLTHITPPQLTNYNTNNQLDYFHFINENIQSFDL